MKTIAFTTLFLTISFFSFGQLASSETSSARDAKVESGTKCNYEKHNNLMAKQLQKHMSTEIEYSGKMKSDCVEGKVILNIKVDENGNLIDVKIAKPLSSDCDDIVLNAIESFPAIVLKEGTYQGANSFLFPIDFKLL